MLKGELGRLALRVPPFALLLMVAPPLAVLLRLGLGREWYRRSAGRVVYRGWVRLLLRVCGVRLRVEGQPVPGALWVANHISWLDVALVAAVHPPCFVAKAEVARWPWLGPLVRIAGTLFLERGSLSALQATLGEVEGRLAAGETVLVFPEGTTTTGETVRPFGAALFQAATRLGHPVQPVALGYPNDPDGRAPFVGEMGFLAHVLRLLGGPGLIARISFLPVTAGSDRRALAAVTREAVVGCLVGSDEAESCRGSLGHR